VADVQASGLQEVLGERRRMIESISLGWKAEREYQVPLCDPKAPSVTPTLRMR
jgi:hypothetical protein